MFSQYSLASLTLRPVSTAVTSRDVTTSSSNLSFH